MFVTVINWLVCCIEDCCFGFVPDLGPDEVCGEYVPTRKYYFLDDPSPRLWQRIRSILACDYRAVSFWKKRRRLLGVRWI